jgi:opacity protein-like surface antigen
MKRMIVAALAAVVVAAPTPSAQAQKTNHFRGRLSPVPITIPQADTVTGSGSMTATVAGSKLSVSGYFEGLQTPATVARIHRGPKTGVRGPVIFELKVSKAVTGTLSGDFELTAPQVEDLRRERFYVQLHSEEAPEGNLWGWLLSQETRP